MSDVLDELEAALSAVRRSGPSVPTPATPRDRQIDDGSVLRRPVALSAIRHCLAAQETARRRGGLPRLLGVDPLSPEGRRWFQTASDDRRLAAMLDHGDWVALHSLPIGKLDGDLDHLVIGDFGAVAVLVIDAPDSSLRVQDGVLQLDGQPTRELDRAREVREDVASRLGVALGRAVPVAVVVVARRRRSVRVSGRSPVPVLTMGQLHRWLWRREPVLTADETLALASAAERASVWRTRAVVDRGDESRAAEAFSRLDGLVHRARVRRTAWESFALTAILAGLVAVATGAPSAIVQAVASLGG